MSKSYINLDYINVRKCYPWFWATDCNDLFSFWLLFSITFAKCWSLFPYALQCYYNVFLLELLSKTKNNYFHKAKFVRYIKLPSSILFYTESIIGGDLVIRQNAFFRCFCVLISMSSRSKVMNVVRVLSETVLKVQRRTNKLSNSVVNKLKFVIGS